MKKEWLINFLYFVIAIGIMVSIGSFLFVKLNVIDNPLEKDSDSSKSSSKLSLDDIAKLGKEKYNWLSSCQKKNNNFPVFFTNSIVDQTTINNNDVLNIAYAQLTIEDRHETGNTDKVMDGDLNDFIYAWLKYNAKQRING